MRPKTTYLLLCLLGAVLPYWQFFPWLREHGLNITLLLRELFAGRVGAFFGLDVIVSALVLFVFIGVENARRPVRAWWLTVAAVFVVGVSLGLPLFLYLRERERQS